MRIKVNEKSLRGLLDSGAGDSVIDIGTAEMLGIDNTIVKDNINLWDASNRKMDFAGRCTVTFDIPQLQQRITHQFAVLNLRTYKTFLLGRDFFKRMGPVTFDVAKPHQIGGAMDQRRRTEENN